MSPTRMCVGCRGRDPQNQLIRVVCRGDQIVVDLAKTAPGRGAWLHPKPDCFSTALSRKAIARALRLSAGTDVSAIVDFATEKLT